MCMWYGLGDINSSLAFGTKKWFNIEPGINASDVRTSNCDGHTPTLNYVLGKCKALWRVKL